MKRFLFCILSLTMTAKAASPLAGTWQGDVNDQPAVEITIDEANGKISGLISFYFQMLENGKWRVKRKDSTPMLAPKLDSRHITFEVEHHVRHGSPELGPNKKYRVELTGSNSARLWEVGAGGDAPGQGLPLTR